MALFGDPCCVPSWHPKLPPRFEDPTFLGGPDAPPRPAHESHPASARTCRGDRVSRPAVSPHDQVRQLLEQYLLTVDDIVSATGCAPSTIYARRGEDDRTRRTAADRAIDTLYYLVSYLCDDRRVPVDEMRWWLTARSRYLAGATPAEALAIGYVQLVRAAGEAYRDCLAPVEFLELHREDIAALQRAIAANLPDDSNDEGGLRLVSGGAGV